jgi:pyruvate/2-oxoglutarate dehydrogenase complex dihydrolipoamide acyltransferase (E2) component
VIEFRLPDVGEGLEEAEVMRWLVAAGDHVERDQPVVEIQTDKALVEIPAPEAGIVSRLGAEVGAIVKVGQLLFVLDAGGQGAGDGKRGVAGTAGAEPLGAADAAREKEEAKAEETRTPAGPSAAAGGGAGTDLPAATGPRRIRPRAAPAVRKLAVELGVDLTTVKGSGPDGRVLVEDVRRGAEDGGAAGIAAAAPADELAARRAAAAAARGGAPARTPTGTTALPSSSVPRELGQAAPGRIPVAGVRRVIAQTMTKAWTTIPHIHGHDELDALALVDALRGLRRRAGDRGALLTLSVLFVLAATRALRRFPLVNSSIDVEANEIIVHEDVNVGLAVATPAGLIVPVIRGADRRSLADLATEIDRLARATRERKVKPEELRSGTFTVTNFGSLGGRFASPIIRPPEVGILGFGAIRERPWATGGGRIEVRPVLPISFGADHRLIDGDLSVAFQEYVRDLLSDPVHLLLGE